MKPKIFIGSSSKSLSLAVAIESLLVNDCTPVGWWKAFPVSEFTLESLLKQIDEYDFGIFVFAPDDKVELDGQSFWAPRDNVSLELGMFLAHLGRQRTFIVQAWTPQQGQKDFRIPTDLLGLTVIPVSYGRGKHERERDRDLMSAATNVYSRIQKIIAENGCRLRLSNLDRLNNLAVKTGCDLQLHMFSGQNLHPRSLNGPARLERTSIFRMWADPNADSSIQVSLKHLGGRSCLRIRFAVQDGYLPSDVTIRPCGLDALANSLAAPLLVFDALAPVSPLNGQLKEKEKPVGLAIRIIDGQSTQWKLEEDHHRKVFPISVDDEWHEVRIGLGDLGAWSLFHADGNHLYAAARPDFSVISAVVVEVGSWSESNPGPGSGEVLISNLHLEEAGDLLRQLHR